MRSAFHINGNIANATSIAENFRAAKRMSLIKPLRKEKKWL